MQLVNQPIVLWFVVLSLLIISGVQFVRCLLYRNAFLDDVKNHLCISRENTLQLKGLATVLIICSHIVQFMPDARSYLIGGGIASESFCHGGKLVLRYFSC